MDKREYINLINKEIYGFYEKKMKRKLSFIDKIRVKYISPQGNATYLIRKMQYLYSCGGLKRIWSLFIHVKLARRYGIYIDPQTKIGAGLYIPHPSSIVIVGTTIGENFSIFQNCTVGRKEGYGETNRAFPIIGDNVTMYANSSIIGGGHICNNVTLAAHCCIVKDALEPGIYAGCPGKIIKK